MRRTSCAEIERPHETRHADHRKARANRKREGNAQEPAWEQQGIALAVEVCQQQIASEERNADNERKENRLSPLLCCLPRPLLVPDREPCTNQDNENGHHDAQGEDLAKVQIND